MKKTFNRFSGKSDKKDNESVKSNDSRRGKKPLEGQKPRNQDKNSQPKRKTDARFERAQPRNQLKKVVQKSAGNATRNNAGLNQPKNKNNPFVNFGPVMQEFLASTKMVDKKVEMMYVQDSDSYDISVCFKTVLENGVSIGPDRKLLIEDYMLEKAKILGQTEPNAKFIIFCGKVLDRLGIDITKARPKVNPNNVERFILLYLSPIEREVVKLSKEEWDTVDSDKLGKMLAPTKLFVDKYFEGKRADFLLKSINSDNPAVIEQPNWVAEGLAAVSKATLLTSLRVEKKEFTNQQEVLMDRMKQEFLSSFNAGGVGGGEETKVTDNEEDR